MTQKVIYVTKNSADLVHEAASLGITRSCTAWLSTDKGHTVAPYEPAIPRCKTCAYFKESDGIIQTGYCYVARTVNGPVPRHVPLDGSGFCHMHEVIF